MTPVHLFDPPPAYLRGVSAVDGYHFAADAIFRGETRAPGAMLTYSVAQGSDELTATVEIVDLSGEVIRTLEGPAKTGLNRIVWDLKETSLFSEQPEGGRTGLLDWRSSPAAMRSVCRSREPSPGVGWRSCRIPGSRSLSRNGS